MQYISELAPAQIRGTLLCSYGWGFSIGQLLSSVALQVVNKTDPTNYLKAIYSEWVPLGLWIILLVFMPESPWYYARKGQAEKAIKTLNRIYKGVDDYDAEREYAVMVREIEQEQELREIQSKTAWMDLFRGVDAVSHVSHAQASLADLFQEADIRWCLL